MSGEEHKDQPAIGGKESPEGCPAPLEGDVKPDTAEATRDALAEGVNPAELNTEMEASAWGSPWSAAENGWNGEDMPLAGGAGTPPPLPPYAALGTGEEDTPPPAMQQEAQKKFAEEPVTEKPMTLMEHLGELRVRLVRCSIAVALAFTACYGVADILFNELCRPLVAALPPGSKLIYTALPEAFFVYMQVGFVAAIFVASPYIFYQIWAFVAPGLYEEEKKYMLPMAACSAFFFIAGASFCFFVVFPFAFTFFVGFATEDIAAMPSLKEYLGFALKLLIAFGLIFEMPLFTFFLARMGMVTAALMRKMRRYAILVIFIVAAILTPPDVMSQLLMAVPMLGLYELSIWVAAAFGRKKKENETGETTEPTEPTEAEETSAPNKEKI